MPPAGLRKAKGHAAKVLKAAEPQLLEGDKKLLFLRGEHPSALGVAVAKDLLALKKPDVHRLTRRNEVRPFEDAAPLEFLAEKAGCAAFLLATHNKKRPHNLVLGRIFASHVLDLVELGVAAHAPLSAFAGSKKALAAPPLLVFAGAEWAAGSAAAPDLALVRASLLDVFAARDRPGVALQGLDHVLLVAVEGALIHFRGYFMSAWGARGALRGKLCPHSSSRRGRAAPTVPPARAPLPQASSAPTRACRAWRCPPWARLSTSRCGACSTRAQRWKRRPRGSRRRTRRRR